MARIVELIFTTHVRGQGTGKDVARNVSRLWTKGGVLVAEFDPAPEHSLVKVLGSSSGAGLPSPAPDSWWTGEVNDAR